VIADRDAEWSHGGTCTVIAHVRDQALGLSTVEGVIHSRPSDG
jgi:hypothetical protein